jgi:hypothetical protein
VIVTPASSSFLSGELGGGLITVAGRSHRRRAADAPNARYAGSYPSSGIATEAEQRGVGWRARERMRDGAMHRSIADNLPINRSAWPTLRKRRCWRARSPCLSAPY